MSYPRYAAVRGSAFRCGFGTSAAASSGRLFSDFAELEIHPANEVIGYAGSRELIDGHALASWRGE